jgi:hypothetical protein
MVSARVGGCWQNLAREDWIKLGHETPLTLGLIKMSAQDVVHEMGLWDFGLVGRSLHELFVVVCDDELLIFLREGPGANAAIQCTSLTGVALYVVTLLAERLPIAKLVRAVPGAGYSVVRAELHFWFLFPARRASVAVFLLERGPIFLAQLCPRLTLLAHIQVLQLVTRALFNDRGEPFFALQLAHSTENVLIGLLVLCMTIGIDRRTNIVFAQNWPRNPVSGRPKCLQDYGVIALICRTRRDEASLRIGEPSLPAGLRFVRRGPRFDGKALTSARFCHFAVEY